MLLHEIFQEVGALQHNAATSGLGGELAEIAQILGLHEDVFDVSFVADVLFRELDDGARLDGTPRADVVADAGGGGAERLAIVLIVRVHQHDGFLHAHLHHELADLHLLLGCEAELRVGIRAHGAIRVIPRIHHTHLDETVQPLFTEEVFEIRLAQTGGDAGHQLVIEAALQASHRTGEHVVFAAAFIADDLVALDADERRHVAHLVHLLGEFIRDELAIREDLEVTVLVLGKDIEQPLIHEGFAAEDAEEAVACGTGFADKAVQVFGGNLFLFGGDVHPAALATEVAAIEHGDVEEGREVFTALHALFEELHGTHAAPAEVVGQLQQEPFIRLNEQSFGKAQIHL